MSYDSINWNPRPRAKNGQRAKTKPGIRYVAYCPECHQSHPDKNPAVSVKGSGGPQQVTCSRGHKFIAK